MALFNLRGFSGIHSRVSEGVQALSADPSIRKWLPRRVRLNFPFSLKTWGKIRAGMVSGIFLIVSAVFAWSAQEIVRGNALKEWESKRIPSLTTWRYALSTRGFHSPQDTATQNTKNESQVLHRAMRSLPSMLDNPGSIWISEEKAWIAVYRSAESAAEADGPHLFCSRCQDPPHAWEPEGAGWSGFDQVIAILDKRPHDTPNSKSEPKKQRFQDPRALEY